MIVVLIAAIAATMNSHVIIVIIVSMNAAITRNAPDIHGSIHIEIITVNTTAIEIITAKTAAIAAITDTNGIIVTTQLMLNLTTHIM